MTQGACSALGRGAEVCELDGQRALGLAHLPPPTRMVGRVGKLHVVGGEWTKIARMASPLIATAHAT